MNKKIRNELEVLASIQQQILNSDSKSVGLLTALGIVFSFSLFTLDSLNMEKMFVKLTVVIYLSSFLVTLFLLSFVLFPRRKKRKEKRHSPYFSRYYYDVYKKSKDGDFIGFIGSDLKGNEIEDQIRICSRIQFWKETLLRCSFFGLCLFSISLIGLIISLLF